MSLLTPISIPRHPVLLVLRLPGKGSVRLSALKSWRLSPCSVSPKTLLLGRAAGEGSVWTQVIPLPWVLGCVHVGCPGHGVPPRTHRGHAPLGPTCVVFPVFLSRDADQMSAVDLGPHPLVPSS